MPPGPFVGDVAKREPRESARRVRKRMHFRLANVDVCHKYRLQSWIFAAAIEQEARVVEVQNASWKTSTIPSTVRAKYTERFLPRGDIFCSDGNWILILLFPLKSLACYGRQDCLGGSFSMDNHIPLGNPHVSPLKAAAPDVMWLW